MKTICLGLLCSASLYAGGSSYSRYGFGDLIRYGDSRLYAMGNTGIAFLDETCINGLNPAGLSSITLTRFSGGFEFHNFNSQEISQSSSYSFGGFQGLSFAVPISINHGVVISFQATPLSTVRYAIANSTIDPMVGLTRIETYYGSGGLTNFAFAASWSVDETIHLGGRLNYIFGSTRQYMASKFTNSSYLSTTLDQSVYYSGVSFSLGVIYTGLEKVVSTGPLKNLTLGAVITTGTTLDVEQQMVYSSYDSTFTANGRSQIPLSLGLGVVYKFQERYRFAGDFVLEQWSSSTEFQMNTGSLNNVMRFSVGGEVAPVRNASGFFDRLAYRLGLIYNSTYYNIRGHGIDELTAAAGLGFPLGPDARLNIGMQVGVRGTTSDNLQKDTIIRFSVGITASELWFMTFDEE